MNQEQTWISIYKASFMGNSIKNIWLKRLANTLLPHLCPHCRTFCEGEGLCAACWKQLHQISEPFCSCCGRPLAHALPDSRCASCWVAPPPLNSIRAACRYDDIASNLVIRYKHADALHLTPLLARLMRRFYEELSEPNQLVIPIPLERRRYFRRRYNQSAELARYMAPDNFAPSLLIRQRNTPSQAGKNRQQRINNVRGAFVVPPAQKSSLAARPIMLIDDVMTTGATLFEAARTLQKSGAGPICVLVIARVN